MSRFALIAAATYTFIALAPVQACEIGLYRSPDGPHRVAVTKPGDKLRYTFNDGRRGEVGIAGSPLLCREGRLVAADRPTVEWPKVVLRLTPAAFTSHGDRLSGTLVETERTAASAPLVVLVHGSERTSPMAGAYPYILASYGLRVFAYDKRGTGGSEGEYTQNFELLADDAAAAFAEARRLAAGRFGRIGYFGGSQGGWIAPLAATRSPADFVAVGFGLMVSPIDEDREQVMAELRELGYDAAVLAAAREVTDATAELVRSHFTRGFEALSVVRRRYGNTPWFKSIKGEVTGEILSLSEAELRRIGRARIDNLELIWDYDAPATLARVSAPQLWVIAEADREAPPATTMARLDELRAKGADITVYSFPGTDHGMVEFTEAADGSRTYGRITDGYYRLLAEWITGKVTSGYGRGRRR